MGIDVRVESESGESQTELGDSHELTDRLLPNLDDDSSPCLLFVDPYGDTTFNHFQLPLLIRELETAINSETDDAVKAHGRQIRPLARRANSELHTYFKFFND